MNKFLVGLVVGLPIALLTLWFLLPANYYKMRCDGEWIDARAKLYTYSSGGCVYLRDSLLLTRTMKCSCDFITRVDPPKPDATSKDR